MYIVIKKDTGEYYKGCWNFEAKFTSDKSQAYLFSDEQEAIEEIENCMDSRFEYLAQKALTGTLESH